MILVKYNYKYIFFIKLKSYILFIVIVNYLYFQEFVKMLDLQPDQRVIDVGCGIGGSAFHMAQVFII